MLISVKGLLGENGQATEAPSYSVKLCEEFQMLAGQLELYGEELFLLQK